MLALCTHQRIYHHTPSCTWYSKPRVGSLSVQVRDKKLEISYRAVHRHTHTHTQHPAAHSLYPRAPVKCRSTFPFVHTAYIVQKLYESMANHGARNMFSITTKKKRMVRLWKFPAMKTNTQVVGCISKPLAKNRKWKNAGTISLCANNQQITFLSVSLCRSARVEVI